MNPEELLRKALQPILERYQASLDHVEDLEIDYEGPRITVKLKPTWANTLYIDASPDGVELVAALPAPKDLDEAEAEATAEDIIEDQDWTATIEEYDTAYNPETGELILTIEARLLQHLPTAQDLQQLLQQLRRELEEQ